MQGSINKFLVDDKGTTMLLCFGLPPVVHNDDAVRIFTLMCPKSISRIL